MRVGLYFYQKAQCTRTGIYDVISPSIRASIGKWASIKENTVTSKKETLKLAES